jgi:peptidoglycan/xylan/chitin deacetylase (PgdA/CDA1 family)
MSLAITDGRRGRAGRGVWLAALGAALLMPLLAGPALAAPDTTPPSVPQGLTGEALAKRYVQLSWLPSTDDSGLAVRYRVFRDDVAIGKKTTATNYLDRPASVGTYRYKVRAIDAAGNKSAFSTTIYVTAVKSLAADTTPPSVPRNFSGTVGAKRYITLSWSASTDNVPGTISYRVFRNDVAIGTKTTATHYVDRPDAPGTYRYKVRAIDAAGNKSPFSYTIERTVSRGELDTTPPTVPQGISAEQGAHGRAVISWQASSDDRVGDIWYHVLRDGRLIATVKSTSFEDWPAGLLADTYTYSVRAADGAGNVSLMSTSAATDVAPGLYPWGGVVYRNGSRQQPLVALTFDDGYRSANMTAIANILRDHGAAGTFFPTGEAVDNAPGVWANIARDFPVANHTYSHPNLTTRTAEQIESQIRRATLAIEAQTDRAMPPMMRPPGGSHNTTVREVLQAMGLPVILWDIDTRDWEGLTAAEVRDKALAAKNGSIVLLHDGTNVVQALPEIINGLRAKGFRLVSLDELLGLPWQPAFR